MMDFSVQFLWICCMTDPQIYTFLQNNEGYTKLNKLIIIGNINK